MYCTCCCFVVFVVDFVVHVVIVVNVVVVALFVVIDNIYIQFWSIKVNLRLLKARVEFLWWVGGVVLQSHFDVKPNYSVEVVFCCCCGCDKRRRGPCSPL